MNARRQDYNDAPNCWIGTEKGSVMTDSNGVQPKLLLETTLNIRDLGVYHSVLHGKQLRPWRILRSDVQNYPSENDIRLLTERKICTIIDLRGEKEVQRKPSGFAGREGFTYHNIPVEEGSGIPESVDAVSDSYIKIAESERMAEVFCAIAMAPDGVMINCTAGKDRTGCHSIGRVRRTGCRNHCRLYVHKGVRYGTVRADPQEFPGDRYAHRDSKRTVYGGISCASAWKVREFFGIPCGNRCNVGGEERHCG